MTTKTIPILALTTMMEVIFFKISLAGKEPASNLVSNYHFLILIFFNIKKLTYIINLFSEFSEHEFIIKEVITKTGKKAGSKKFTVKLIIPPFSFRKKTNSKMAGSKDIFVCNACEKEDVQNVAHAILDNLNENGKPEYSLCMESL